MGVLSDDFAAVDLREELCYHSLTEKANPEVFQKENPQKRKPRSSSGPAAVGAVKYISILSSYRTICFTSRFISACGSSLSVFS